MALDSATISSMYRKYLGRDASPKDIALVTAKGFAATPESLQSLLTNTASSIRKKAMSTADANIKTLTGDQQPEPLTSTAPDPKAAYEMYGGQLPDYGSFQAQNPSLRRAQGEYDTALDRYGSITERAMAQPERSKAQLKAGSYFFGESYDDIQKRYSDPSSPYFIPNPDDRAAVVDRSMKQRNTTLQDTISKISSIYDVLTTAASNELAGRREKVTALQKMVEKTYDGLMSYFGERRAEDFKREQSATEHGYRMREIGASQSGRDRNVATITKTDENGLPYDVLVDVDTGQEIYSGANMPMETEEPVTVNPNSYDVVAQYNQYKQGNKQDSGLMQQVKNLTSKVSRPTQRAFILNQANQILNTQGEEGLRGFLETQALTTMAASERDTYNQFANAVESLSSAKQFLEPSSLTVGPYRNLAQQSKPYLLMQKDDKYIDLFSNIERGQAQIRKGYYGTAITSTEKKTGQNFLISNNDDMNTIRRKIAGNIAFFKFANDAQLARLTGGPKPKLSDYLTQYGVNSGSPNLGGLSGGSSLNKYVR